MLALGEMGSIKKGGQEGLVNKTRRNPPQMWYLGSEVKKVCQKKKSLTYVKQMTGTS
jgi:hypothetical protein